MTSWLCSCHTNPHVSKRGYPFEDSKIWLWIIIPQVQCFVGTAIRKYKVGLQIRKQNIFPPCSASVESLYEPPPMWSPLSNTQILTPSPIAPVSCDSSWRAQSRPDSDQWLVLFLIPVIRLGNFILRKQENQPLLLGDVPLIPPFVDDCPLPCDGKSHLFFSK